MNFNDAIADDVDVSVLRVLLMNKCDHRTREEHFNLFQQLLDELIALVEVGVQSYDGPELKGKYFDGEAWRHSIQKISEEKLTVKCRLLQSHGVQHLNLKREG